MVDEAVRDSWVAETLDATQDRLGALESGETEEADAVLAVYEGNTADVEAAVEDAVEELVAEMDVPETPAQ
jgi:RPA family protein